MNTFLYLSTVLILIALIFTEQRKRVKAEHNAGKWTEYANTQERLAHNWEQHYNNLLNLFYEQQSGKEGSQYILPLTPTKEPVKAATNAQKDKIPAVAGKPNLLKEQELLNRWKAQGHDQNTRERMLRNWRKSQAGKK